MAKKKGLDPIADAQQLAQHNINPHYWVNKVTSHTYTRWMVEKKLSALELLVYVILGVTLYLSITNTAESKGVGIWNVLKDFRDIRGPSYWVAILFMSFYTLIWFIRVIQVFFKTRLKPDDLIPKPEKKKKMPRHRKDYH